MSDKIIKKIVLTGGPCGGKTTAMSWIQNAFDERGYKVIFVPETATELITAGVCPWTTGTNLDYQKCQFKLQLEKEKAIYKACQSMPDDKILIVHDRGALDNKAYMTQSEFDNVMEYVGIDETSVRDYYDAIFHMETAAKGAESYYSKANNEIRYESAEDAIKINDAIIKAWTGHPHLHIIDNRDDFKQKMRSLIKMISQFLDERAPYDTKKKYLIEFPDVEQLRNLPNSNELTIIKTFINCGDNEEYIAISRTGKNGEAFVSKHRKYIGSGQEILLERRLTKKEYLEKLQNADITKKPIVIDRFYIVENNQYYRVDIFPFWRDKAIVKIEQEKNESKITFPSYLKIIKEITNDDSFNASKLASLE